MITRRSIGLAASSIPFWWGSARAAQGAMSASIKLTGQRVLISAELNGKPGYTFALDTGAVVSGIRDQVALDLKLPVTGSAKLNEGQKFPLYAVNSLVLGETIRQSNLSLFGLPGERLGADGLLAANMLTRFDSELDFDALQWRIFPEGRADRDRSGYSRLPTEFIANKFAGGSRRMFGVARIDGRVVDVLLDTGSPWSLSLDNKTGEKLGLWRDDVAYAPVSQFTINGRKSPARLVRAGALDVGGVLYSNPLVVVRAPDAPPMANILGLGTLRTLNLMVDREDDRLWIKRNAHPQTQHRYPGSGLLLETAGPGVRAVDVGYGSPAFKAGMRAGDLVVGPGSAQDLTASLSRPPGTDIRLHVERDGRTRELDFKLLAYL